MMTTKDYKAALKRIEEIKVEIERLRQEKVKLIQKAYYFEHKDEKYEKAKIRAQINKNS